MKKHRRLRTFCILAALVLGSASVNPVRGQELIGETWEDKKEQIIAFIDAAASTAAAEFLPPGMGDIVSLMRNSPDIVKQGLREVLKEKMADAITDDDWDRVDRIQAFSSCLEGDCGRLKQLQATWKPGETPPAAPAGEAGTPPPAAAQAAQPVEMGPEGDWFCCQWTHPVSKQKTCAPSRHSDHCKGLPDGEVFAAPNFCHIYKGCTTEQ